MKKIIFSSLFVCYQIFCFGQITITNAYFLNNQDSLVTTSATAQTVKSISISKATTTAQVWDFSFLRARTATARTVEHYLSLNPVSDTAILKEFPTATSVIADSTGQTAVYRTSSTRFDLLGFYNANLGILPIGLNPKFNPPSLERRAPLTFNSTNNNQTGFSLPFSTSIIPDTFLAMLPLRPDSIRIRFTTSRQDKIDAFGKIRIPGSTDIDCLRERRYEITETHIDTKSNALPIWFDITNLLPTTNFQTRDTSLVFLFWSNQYKEPLVTIYALNDSTPIAAEFKWLAINTPTLEIPTSEVSAILYPIPAKEAFFVQFNGLPSQNDCFFNIVDNTGRVVLTKKIESISDNMPLRIDTNQWSSGVYYLNLYSDRERAALVSKMFVIAK